MRKGGDNVPARTKPTKKVLKRHKEELKALKRLSGRIKVDKETTKGIIKECNGKVYIKRRF